jgi:hypothetical protein
MRGRIGGMARKLLSREWRNFIHVTIVAGGITAACVIGEVMRNPPNSLWEKIGLGVFVGVFVLSWGLILRSRLRSKDAKTNSPSAH